MSHLVPIPEEGGMEQNLNNVTEPVQSDIEQVQNGMESQVQSGMESGQSPPEEETKTTGIINQPINNNNEIESETVKVEEEKVEIESDEGGKGGDGEIEGTSMDISEVPLIQVKVDDDSEAGVNDEVRKGAMEVCGTSDATEDQEKVHK